MTRPMYRRMALAGVFGAGIFSIMGTESMPEFYFEEITVSPQNRCPGTDARLQWSLNQPARVVVERGGNISDMGRETELALPTAELDEGPDLVRFTLNIIEDAPYVPLGEAKMATVRGITRATEPPLEWDRHSGVYLYRLDPAKWDPRLQIARISIANPANQQCANQDGWEVRWKVERRSGDKFVFNAKNGFEKNFKPTIPVVGEWVLVADLVERPLFKGKRLAPVCSAPRLEFSVVCEDGPAPK